MEPRKVLSGLVTKDTIDKALEKIRSDPQFQVDGCHYEIAREYRHQDVVNFIRAHFFPHEPIVRSIAHILPWTDEFEALWMIMIKEGMSLILVSDTTGEIVAVRITRIGKKEEHFDKNEIDSEGFRKLIALTYHMRTICNVYEYYGVEELIEFMALCVHRDYRMKGIGLRVMKAAIALVKNLGLGGVIIKGEGSSNYSKKIYEKCGFDTLAELLYEDFKENGEIVFKNMGEHKSLRQYGKFVD